MECRVCVECKGRVLTRRKRAASSWCEVLEMEMRDRVPDRTRVLGRQVGQSKRVCDGGMQVRQSSRVEAAWEEVLMA